MHSLILKPQQYLEMSPKTALKKKKFIGAFTRFFFFLGGGGSFIAPPKKCIALSSYLEIINCNSLCCHAILFMGLNIFQYKYTLFPGSRRQIFTCL